MRKSAHVSAFIHFFLSTAAMLCIGLLFFFGISQQAHAQTTYPTPTLASQPAASTFEDFRTPYIAPDVDRNLHNYSQIFLIDILSAFVCQLAGIDPTNVNRPCIGVNPTTGQFGYAVPQNQFGQVTPANQQYGAISFMSNQIGYLYTPPASTGQYTSYLAQNFGITKPALAQLPQDVRPSPLGPQFQDCNAQSNFGYGFCSLQIIFNMWTLIRDAAYAILTLAFIFLGLGVMVRFKVDPRTVMSLQNQIPRVIIAILLITFSYAIAGLMIDLMWTTTYTGINMITRSFDGELCGEVGGGGNNRNLAEVSTFNLIDQPINYVDKVYSQSCDSFIESGIFNIAGQVSYALGDIIEGILMTLFGLSNDYDCGVTNLLGCIQEGFTFVMSYLTTIVAFLIILCILLIALFRIWWVLLRTYVSLLMFIILGPIWIVMGLIPGRPLGFEKWLRVMFANLAAFPLVALTLVFGRMLMDAVPYTPSPQSLFIPPLIGNPNANNAQSNTFGILLGFGAILLAPTIPDLIKEKMKASGGMKYGAAIAGAVGMGAGMAAAPAAKMVKHLNRRDPQTGRAVGALATAKETGLRKFVPGGKALLERREAARQRAHSREPLSKKAARVKAAQFTDAQLSDKVRKEREKRRNTAGQQIHWYTRKKNRTPMPPPQSRPNPSSGGDSGDNTT